MDEQSRKVVHSSDRMDWRTPPDLFKALNADYNFIMDAAASHENHLCDYYATEKGVWDSGVIVNKDLDGLTAPWAKTTFCNPPYGRGVKAWFKKAYEESQKGNTCVLLIAARTDTIYWHEYAMKAYEVRLIKGRVKFLLPDGTETAPAPFPSAVVIFKPGATIRTAPKFSSWRW